MPENVHSSLPEAENTPPLLQGIAETRATLANLENTPLDAEGQEQAKILCAKFNESVYQICQESSVCRTEFNDAVVENNPELGKTPFPNPLDKGGAAKLADA